MLRDTPPVVLKGRVAWLAAAPPKKRGFVNKTRTGRIADEQVEDACSLPRSMDFADAARQPRALVTRATCHRKQQILVIRNRLYQAGIGLAV